MVLECWYSCWYSCHRLGWKFGFWGSRAASRRADQQEDTGRESSCACVSTKPAGIRWVFTIYRQYHTSSVWGKKWCASVLALARPDRSRDND
eukprot:scaffold3574_cov49-Attheya_sp.AAC.4